MIEVDFHWCGYSKCKSGSNHTNSYVQVDTHVIYRALNALVNVNSKLEDGICIVSKLQFVVACYLVSMLLLN